MTSRMAVLESKVATQARAERPQIVGGNKFGNDDKYVAKSTFDLATLEPHEQANAARERLAEIRADFKHPYWNENHPGHAGALEEVHGLYAAQHMESGGPLLVDDEK